ncbi:MAG: hypothetical protein ACLU41_00665 [Anaerotignum lactatifermentans]
MAEKFLIKKKAEIFGKGFQLFIITLVLKAAKQPLTTARSAGEIKA